MAVAIIQKQNASSDLLSLGTMLAPLWLHLLHEPLHRSDAPLARHNRKGAVFGWLWRKVRSAQRKPPRWRVGGCRRPGCAPIWKTVSLHFSAVPLPRIARAYIVRTINRYDDPRGV